ncbi:MAG TPA: LacI family transcriptional regulator, partial [Clostridiales bacterium]|nr:LacI family transcriptional regulator [Clostridiales bacterium]
MPMTTKDIARIAGVSQATVSRSLNNSPLISEGTRRRILDIALEQGFEFNASARSLSTNSSGTIGVIYPDNYSAFNLYLSSLHDQLRSVLEREEYDLIVTFEKNQQTGTSHIRKLILSR